MNIQDALNWLLYPTMPRYLAIIEALSVGIVMIVALIAVARLRREKATSEHFFASESWRVEELRRYAQGLCALLFIKTGIRYDRDDITERADELLDANGAIRSDLKAEPRVSHALVALIAAVLMEHASKLRGYAKMLNEHHEGAWPNVFSVPAALEDDATKLDGLFHEIMASLTPKPKPDSYFNGELPDPWDSDEEEPGEGAEDWRYCPACGYPLDGTPKECPNCGHEIAYSTHPLVPGEPASV